MLIINKLNVSYKKNHVLENLSIDLNISEIHGIVGLNGAGKTTLLNTIFGIKKADSGNIYYNNSNINKKYIAFLETQNYFYPKITGKEYLELFRLNNKDFEISEWNKLFTLPLNKLIETYSTGMKKKLAFMGTMCLDKPIIILDEPFNGVDLESNRKIKEILMRLKVKGKTIIITSHILESLTNICDTISYLKTRKIEFTVGKNEFSSVEEKIFNLQDNDDKDLIENLLM